MKAVVFFCLKDLFRSRFVLFYFLFHLAAGFGIMQYAPNASAGLGALLSLVIFLAPLCSIVFGTLYFYQSRGFQELMLAQPVGRMPLLAGQGLAVAAALGTAFCLGLGIPTVLSGLGGPGEFATLALFLGGGLLLHLSFLALAFLVAIGMEDRLRGFSTSLVIWLALVFLYDGVLLFLLTWLSDYPLDRLTIGAILLNPVDLERILVLMRLDASVMLGYTGAVFRRFFGTSTGIAAALGAMAFWVAVPALLFFARLRKKDF